MFFANSCFCTHWEIFRFDSIGIDSLNAVRNKRANKRQNERESNLISMKQKSASSGNRTRVSSMATMNSATRPTMLVDIAHINLFKNCPWLVPNQIAPQYGTVTTRTLVEALELLLHEHRAPQLESLWETKVDSASWALAGVPRIGATLNALSIEEGWNPGFEGARRRNALWNTLLRSTHVGIGRLLLFLLCVKSHAISYASVRHAPSRGELVCASRNWVDFVRVSHISNISTTCLFVSFEFYYGDKVCPKGYPETI